MDNSAIMMLLYVPQSVIHHFFYMELGSQFRLHNCHRYQKILNRGERRGKVGFIGVERILAVVQQCEFGIYAVKEIYERYSGES